MHPLSMERRLYTRVCDNVGVSVYCEGVLVAKRNTVDFSVGGLSLDTEDLGLTEHSLVDIAFDVSHHHSLHNKKIPAIITRIEPGKLALHFENLEKGTEDLIKAARAD